MPYISSAFLILIYVYTLIKLPYVRQSKLFLLIYSLFLFRLILSFNHEFSFQPIIAGQSINSIFSILSVLLLGFSVSTSFFKIKAALPLYLLVITVLMSGVYSGLVVGAAIVAMKWLLLLFFVACILDLFRSHGLVNTLKPFHFVFVCLLFAQLVSLILGQGKDTESLSSESNSISYIAGYAHEGAFSMLIYMGLIISSMLLLYKECRGYYPLLFFIGLILANYRTVILAAFIPLLFIYLSTYYHGRRSDFKAIVICFFFIFILSILTLFGESIISRFGELGTAFSLLGELMSRDYTYFTIEDKRLLSSRLYLWNMYITEYRDFNFIQQLLGKGPEAWVDYFVVYAHNNFIGALFDFGVFGLIALVYLFYNTLLNIKKIKDKKMKIVLAGLLIGFFIMSNSTMPFSAVEGIYTFSFLLAVSVFHAVGIIYESSLSKLYRLRFR